MHAEHEPRDTIVLVKLNDAIGIFDGFIHLTVHKERKERTVEQFTVARVTFERRPVIGRSCPGVALLAGMTGCEIVARRRDAAELRWTRRLRGKLDGCCRENGGKRAAGNAAGEARRRHGLVLQ